MLEIPSTDDPYVTPSSGPSLTLPTNLVNDIIRDKQSLINEIELYQSRVKELESNLAQEQNRSQYYLGLYLSARGININENNESTGDANNYPIPLPLPPDNSSNAFDPFGGGAK
eukprot:TRINITY_DN1775_c0_g1_i1.p1 TRINITY_DN1775_c0_g1~~TRINITY_DN1775_c0_g1_i1.p1  ORF type:complete len:114 (-),score=17.82 TRINITY_DN1775_c0_g1_i1:606-947(-)